MSYIIGNVNYTAPCPKCDEDALWIGTSVGEYANPDERTTRAYSTDSVVIAVKCRKCDAKDMRWHE